MIAMMEVFRKEERELEGDLFGIYAARLTKDTINFVQHISTFEYKARAPRTHASVLVRNHALLFAS